MAELETPTNIQDDDVADVSLVNPTPPAPTDEATPASVPAEQGKDDAAATPKDDVKSEDDKPVEGEDKTPEQDKDPAEPAEPAKPEDTPEDRARLAKQEFQQRQRTRNQVAQQIDQVYGPKTQEDLVNEGMDARDAQIEALRQEMAYKEQRTQIAEMNATLQAEAVNVMHDMPVFDANSKQYDPSFTAQVERAYQVAARLQTDENGIVLNAEVPVYDFYKQMYDIRTGGISQGSQSGQQDALQMLANTESVGGSSSTSKGPETLEEMEARLGDVVIT